jgi:hypothetical protein
MCNCYRRIDGLVKVTCNDARPSFTAFAFEYLILRPCVTSGRTCMFNIHKASTKCTLSKKLTFIKKFTKKIDSGCIEVLPL